MSKWNLNIPSLSGVNESNAQLRQSILTDETWLIEIREKIREIRRGKIENSYRATERPVINFLSSIQSQTRRSFVGSYTEKPNKAGVSAQRLNHMDNFS